MSGAGVVAGQVKLSEARGHLPWVAVLFLLMVFIPLRFQAGPLLLTNMRLLLMLLVIPLAINLLRGRYGRILPTDWLFFGHVLWIAIALSQTTPGFAISQMGSVGVEFIGAYLIGRATIRNRTQFLALLRCLLIALALLVPFVLYELQTGRSILIETLNRLPGVRSENIAHIEGRMGFERVQATFPHPIHFGLFCSSLFALTLVGLKGAVSTQMRLALAGMVAFGAWSSLSSGAILPMLMQIGLVTWAALLNKVRRRWIILTVLSVIAYVVVDLLSDRTPMMVFFSYATFSPHNAYWRAQIFDWGWMNIFGSSSLNIPAAPLFGIGMGDWVRPHYMYSGSMDNFWLVMGVRYGVPGFLTVAAGMAWLVTKIALRRDLDDDPQLWSLRRAWVITFIGVAVVLCTVHVWTASYAYVFFLLGAGAWLLTAEPATGTTERAEAPVESGARRAYSRFGASIAPSGPKATPVYARRPTTDPAFAEPRPRRRTSRGRLDRPLARPRPGSSSA